MNIIKFCAVSCLVALLFACSDSSTNTSTSEQAAVSNWIEGEHYAIIEDAPSMTNKNVKEYFSFWCPHCYASEPFMQQLKANLPSDLPFIKVHVNFMGFLPSTTQDIGTQALIASRVNGTEDAFSAVLFDAIHVERKSLNSLMNFSPIFKQTAIDGEALSTLLRDDEVKSLVEENNQFVAQIRKHLKGVPAIVVNDKYYIDLTMGMSFDETTRLIIWLSEK